MDNYKQFCEFEKHLLNDHKPSLYFRTLAKNGLLADTYPFTMLEDLQRVEQQPEFHPEGNVWEHTLLVVDMAAEGRHLSKNPRVLMWASLLHDLGKAPTTKVRRGKITSYDHDIHGARLAAEFLKALTDDEEFINHVSQMVRWHMQILYVNKNLPIADVDKMLTEVPLGEIALISLCDRLGRGNMNEKTKQKELANVKSFVQQCQQDGVIN
jgi:putative nucleotidyltransferase with HDIG domain